MCNFVNLYLVNSIGCAYCDGVLYFSVKNKNSKNYFHNYYSDCDRVCESLSQNCVSKFLKIIYNVLWRCKKVINVSRTYLSFMFIVQPLTASAYEGL